MTSSRRFSKEMLDNIATFIKLISTGGKTWFYEYGVETVQHSAKDASNIRRNRKKTKIFIQCMEIWIKGWQACISSEGANLEGDNKDEISKNVVFFVSPRQM